MSSRVNHPLKSFALFLMVAAIGYGAYYALIEKQLLRGRPDAHLTSEERDRLREMVLDRFERDQCFLELGEVVYRPRENLYRIEFRSNHGCEARAKEICREISDLVEDTIAKRAAVWARDDAGNNVAHHVP